MSTASIRVDHIDSKLLKYVTFARGEEVRQLLVLGTDRTTVERLASEELSAYVDDPADWRLLDVEGFGETLRDDLR